MVTLDHLPDAWGYALFEINSAINHWESGEGQEITDSGEDSQQAAHAWLDHLRHHCIKDTALLARYPSIPSVH